MFQFIIKNNKYLGKDTLGYYNQDYLGYHQDKNPDFINRLKNMSGNLDEMDLVEDFMKVCELASQDIFDIAKENNMNDVTVVIMPRSKAESNYKQSQLMFKKAISCVARGLSFQDCTNAITRTCDTKTTHDWRLENNNGNSPYKGITKDTCTISNQDIKDKDIILVDDIYTEGVNVCEDCIQTLLDFGAKNVILYVIAKTKR